MSEVVFAVYRPHPGKEKDLEKLIAAHVPTLRGLELITERPAILVKSKNGAYVEIFEWRNEAAIDKAHEHPAVAKTWEAMGKICDFGNLKDLPESEKPFAHFAPVQL